MELNDLQIDPQKEIEGVWIPFSGDSDVLVARAGNPKFKKRFDQLLRPFRRQIRNNTADEEVLEKLYCRAMSETILLGWRGLTLDGKPFEYSPKAAYDLLTEPTMKDTVRARIEEIAQDIELYYLEDEQDTEGNSPGSAAGEPP